MPRVIDMIFLRNVLRAPVRSVMTALGVAAGIALFVAITAITLDLRQQIDGATAAYNLEVVVFERRSTSPFSSRISPEQLKTMLETGARVVIVDLRLPGDFSVEPRTLPGAIRLAPQEVATRHKEIPRDQEVVLYCSCHDEFTSTRAALLLRSYGIHRVRPLAGGYDGWLERKFPLISLDENLKN